MLACCGPAGPNGAWCDDCIRVCREHTLRLDLQRLPEFNTEPHDWSAIFYARAGIPVFPLTPGTKIPLARSRGVNDATTDTRQIRSWWQDCPNYNIGLACGVIFDIVDVDVSTFQRDRVLPTHSNPTKRAPTRDIPITPMGSTPTQATHSKSPTTPLGVGDIGETPRWTTGT
jgi:hypothetical protein